MASKSQESILTLRSDEPWRIFMLDTVKYIGHLLVYSLLAMTIFMVPLRLMPYISTNRLIGYGVSQLLAVGLALSLAWIFQCWISRRSFSELGLTLNAVSTRFFLRGAAIGFVMITLTFLLMLATGAVRVAYAHPSAGALLITVEMFVIQWLQVFSEEIVFRTHPLWKLMERLPVWGACVMWGLFFGLVHLLGKENTPIAIFGIVLAGVFMNFSYFLANRNIWYTVGIHYVWNALEMHVYFSKRLFQISYSGPSWLTGGGDAEACVLSVLVIACALSATIAAYQRRDGAAAPSVSV